MHIMAKKNMRGACLSCLIVVPTCLLSVPAAHAQGGNDEASRISFNSDSPIFTDPTPASQETQGRGGTVGLQRTRAVEFALHLIESEIRIDQDIEIEFVSSDLNCSLFASGTYALSVSNAAGQIPDTLYPIALANQLAGTDFSEPGTADVRVTLNQNILNGDCPQFFSYNRWRVGQQDVLAIDFVEVLLHEISHGLGFEVRPSGNEQPFIFETFLFAKEENSFYDDLSAQDRADAELKVKNIVFTGRLTREEGYRQLNLQRSISSLDDSASFDIPVIEALNSRRVPERYDSRSIRAYLTRNGDLDLDLLAHPRQFVADLISSLKGGGIIGRLVSLNFSTCEPEGSLKNRIVIMPSGCAREELGLDGPREGGIQKAIDAGARAIVIGNGTSSFRFSIFTPTPHIIPIVSVTLEDYSVLNVAAANRSLVRLNRSTNGRRAGTDESGSPFVFTGPDLNDRGVRVLHYDPALGIDTRGHKARALQEPVISVRGGDKVRRSLGFNLPALIDLGWAARRCGNGRMDRLEQCDDGNSISGDGCEQNCLLPVD